MIKTGHLGRVRLYFGLTAVALFIFVSLGYLLIVKPRQELRAIWVQARAANTPDEADKMLDRVVRGGFDTILYGVEGGSVYYRSDLLPRSSYVTSEYDPLAYVVEQGHARGLKVQAWWCLGVAPKSSSFRSRYPMWDIAALEKVPDDFHWLNFSLPEVRQFVGDVVLEIAENYQVDGVHLDCIRYPSPSSYNTEVNCCEFFDKNDVSSAVRGAYQRLKADKPQVQLTAAVFAGWNSHHKVLQYWDDWLVEEYIDCVIPMAYVRQPDELHILERFIRDWQEMAYPERIVPGLIVYYGSGSNKVPKTPEEYMVEMGMCEASGFQGVVAFDEGNISDEILNALAAGSE